MKLANKISTAIFLVAMLCVAAACFGLYRQARHSLKHETEAHLESVAQSRAMHIETYLAMLKVSIGQLSKSVVLENFLTASGAGRDRAGNEFETAMTRLRRTREANPAIAEFLLLDKSGAVIASSRPESIGADKSADAIFLAAREKIALKEVYYSDELHAPLLAVSAPITDSRTGGFLGVLAARVRLDNLNAICAERAGLGASGEIYALNKDGVAITPTRFRPDAVLKLKVDTSNSRLAQLHASREDRAQWQDRPGIYPDYRGTPVLGTHAYIPATQWSLLVESDVREAFAPLNRIFRLFILLILAVPLLAWLIGIWIARSMTRALTELRRGAEIIGSGNLDFKVGTDQKDEIGQLALAFDAMTDRLKTTTTSVENLNREIAERKQAEEKLRRRTAELFEREEDLAITLRSIGDAMIATDTEGKITRLNPVAEQLTGWPLTEAAGKPLTEVFRIVNAQTRAPAPNPIAKVLASGLVTGLANHTALIARDGTVRQIADSAAPIRDADGRLRGVVLIFHDVTAEYHIREVLQKQTDELEGFFYISLDLLCIADLEGNFIKVNKAWEDILGYPVTELERRKFLEFVHPEDMQATLEAIARLGEGKRVLNFTNRYRHKDGSYRFIEWRSNPHGKLIYAAARDITARRQAEEAIRKAKEDWERTFDSVPDMIALIDEKHIITRVNRAMADLLGITPEEAIGRKCYACVHMTDRPPDFCPHARLMNDGRAHTAEFHADNLGKWLDVTVSPMHNAKGEVIGSVHVARDITEHKRAEEALKSSEERFRLLFDKASDAKFIHDPQGKFVNVNQTACERLGYSREELLKLGPGNIDSPEFAARVAERVATLQRTGQAVFESAHVRRDGTLVPVEISAKIITYDGRPAIFSTARDITQRKKAEAALSLAKAELEKANLQLQQELELESKLAVQAQAASAAKSQFVANISHEIRTPLNGIIGVGELLLETKLSNEQLEFAQIINASADALLNIINSTLDFSKIEAGKLELERMDFNLREIIDDITSILAVNAAKKQLELIASLEPDVPRDLNGDPGRLRQILFNLIGNAIKFTPEGEIVVKVELVKDKCSVFGVQGSGGQKDRQSEHRTQNTEHSPAPAVLLRFSVRDTGIGIPADKMELLFQAFSQTDASLARKFGGTGLGLAISKGLVEQMGGAVGAESRHGQGSTFWFVIPFARPKQAAAPGGEPKINFGGARILIVDDNATNRFTLAKQLEAWGVAAETAETGREALAKLRSAAQEHRPYLAAILDQRMPEMDGIALGQAIKRDPEIDATILFLMSSMLLSQKTYSEHAGLFAAMVLKPIRQAHLYYNLLTALKGGALSADEAQWAHTFRQQTAAAAGGKLHILVAEDNMANQKVILGILKNLGHSAVAVGNGQETLKALEMSAYDLVLMDIQMPEMDGLEAARRIRALEAERSEGRGPGMSSSPSSTLTPQPSTPPVRPIPILALTAHTTPEETAKCLAAGMDGYISKPVTTTAVAEALAKYSPAGGARAPAEETRSAPEPAVVFDAQALAARLSGDHALMREVIAVFLEETPKNLRELEKAVREQQSETARRLAHTIKGSAANVGANQLQAGAARLETAGNWREARALIPRLNRQLEILERTMRKFTETLAP